MNAPKPKRGSGGSREPAEMGHRRTERSRDTKEAILEAAAKVLSNQGYEATSLELVASTAGVTKGTVYYHFDSKEAIYAAVLIRYISDAARRAEEAEVSSDDPVEALARIVDEAIADTMDVSKRYIHYQEIVRVREDIRSVVREVQRSYENTIARVIGAGQARGYVIDGEPKLLAMLLIGAIGRTARWYQSDGPVAPDEFAQLIKRFLLEGLLSGGRERPAAG